MDLKTVEDFFKSLGPQELQVCQQMIDKVKKNHFSKPPNAVDFVDYHEKFVDSTSESVILAEIETLGFNHKSPKQAVQNKFLSTFSEPYIWDSSKKAPVVNNPISMDKFPGIRTVMTDINEKFGFKMNSALVTYYKNGSVNARLHDDAEAELDPNQPICVLSFGIKRQVQFVSKGSNDMRISDLTLEPENCSLYIMKSGCQGWFSHRVVKKASIKDDRVSISFRCFVPSTNINTVRIGVQPIKLQPPQASNSTKVPATSSTPNLDSCNQGFSPFPDHQTFSFNGGLNSSSSRQRYCLLFGSSITTRVDEDRMGKGSRVFINLSKSGAKIRDLHKFANDFCSENPSMTGDVDKIVINIGTNDVKWLNGSRYSVFKRFRAPLLNLIKDLKLRFPLAHITFMTMLPIRAFYNYTARTVNDFNSLLLEVCRSSGCEFFDCFEDFLAPDLRDYDETLFWDKWHPNAHGLRILCRAIKCIIYGNTFRSHMRTFWHRPFYA